MIQPNSMAALFINRVRNIHDYRLFLLFTIFCLGKKICPYFSFHNVGRSACFWSFPIRNSGLHLQFHHQFFSGQITCYPFCRTNICHCLHQCQHRAGFRVRSLLIRCCCCWSPSSLCDDTYLLVPASARSTVSSELVNISNWAASNNLRLNADKSKELILYKRITSYDHPQPIPGVERLTSIKILGITLTCDFSTAVHITKVLESCARSLYALCILKSHGMPPAALHEVARATTMARLLYAAPAWWGFALAADCQHIERFILCTVRMGYLPPESLVTDAENRLLTPINHRHYCVLMLLFPPVNSRHPGL